MDIAFPKQVRTRPATEADMEQIRQYVGEYSRLFHVDAETIMREPFTVVTPDSSNPYKQMYVAN